MHTTSTLSAWTAAARVGAFSTLQIQSGLLKEETDLAVEFYAHVVAPIAMLVVVAIAVLGIGSGAVLGASWAARIVVPILTAVIIAGILLLSLDVYYSGGWGSLGP